MMESLVKKKKIREFLADFKEKDWSDGLEAVILHGIAELRGRYPFGLRKEQLLKIAKSQKPIHKHSKSMKVLSQRTVKFDKSSFRSPPDKSLQIKDNIVEPDILNIQVAKDYTRRVRKSLNEITVHRKKHLRLPSSSQVMKIAGGFLANPVISNF